MMLVLVLFLSMIFQPICAEGFKDTLIQTASGYIPINQIKTGDRVLSMNDDGSIGERKVTCTFKHRTQHLYKIEVEQNDIVDSITAKWGQLFVIAGEHKWINVCDLKSGDVVRTATGSAKIKNVIRVKEKSRQKYYTFTVKSTHNFFVSKHNVLVHNFAVFIPLLAWGVGGISYTTVAAIFSAISLGIIGHLLTQRGYRVPGVFDVDFKTGMPRYTYDGGSFRLNPVYKDANGDLPKKTPESGAGSNNPKNNNDDNNKNNNEDPKKPKHPSINQMNQEIHKGRAPDTIKRGDKGGTSESPEDHVHFSDGSALNRNGTWRHTGRKGNNQGLTKAEQGFLQQYGFSLPKGM